jgi:PAS domain S-box-containing protein
VAELPDLSDSKYEFSGLYILTANGKFLYANPRLAEIFGYAFRDFVTLDSFFKLVADNSIKALHAQISACFQNHEPQFVTEFQGRSRNGEVITIEMEGNRTRFYGKSTIMGTVRLV